MFDASMEFLREMVKKLRAMLGVEVVDVTNLTTKVQYDQLELVTKEREDATRVLREMSIINPRIRYDHEYSNAAELEVLTGVPCNFEGTHYWFWSPILLIHKVLGPIIGWPHGWGVPLLDVGAGNGTLILALQSMGSPPHYTHGVDISEGAQKRIKETGGQSFQGTLLEVSDKLPVPEHGYSSIFLSYFIDRDENQRETFRKASELLHRNGGRIILEGLFPCVLADSSGVSYGAANVTKGNDAVEDIQLVIAEFARLSMYRMYLEKIIVGQRLVYSMDGPEVLPSYILVFKKI